MLHRFSKLLLLVGISIITLLILSKHVSWHRIPQTVGLGEDYDPAQDQSESGKDIALDTSKDKPSPNNPLKHGTTGESSMGDGSARLRLPGQPKPPGSNYTKTLVMGRLSHEDTEWVHTELHDMLDSGALTAAIYVVDKPAAPFKVPKNKGHEVMTYLSYIIDSYDDLPDIALFMHSHRYAWHNNELLETDAALTVRHLSPERVIREGYMNLRCHQDPGCPEWLHPDNTVRNLDKQEEVLVGESWAELFPFDERPSMLAQPCCAQFAVSRERILAMPKARYIYLRDWLIRTGYNDYLSGRVFEYLWQYIFTGEPTHCPSMAACICDGYGLCFGSEEGHDYWFELNYYKKVAKEELRIWKESAKAIADSIAKNGQVAEEAVIEVPEVGRDEYLEGRINELDEEMAGLLVKAIERGRDPKQRAKESGRDWKEGDGF